MALRIGFKPGQVGAGFQIYVARGRIEPIDTYLARESAVLGPHDRLGDSVLKQINDRFVIATDSFMRSIVSNCESDRNC
jgi:hypothetical protein